MTPLLRLLVCLCMFAAPAALAQEDSARFGDGPNRMLVRSTTDIQIVRPLIERFVEANPDLEVMYEQWGSNELFANSRAACDGAAAPADAVFSSAVQHMVWLVNASCAQAYRSSRTTALPDDRRWRDELWGLTEEPAVIVYNKRAINGADVPRSRFTLLDRMRTEPDALRGRIATYDIQASGLGYLFAHVDSLEATTFGAMLEGFSRVEAVATCCSAEIIAGVAEGRFLIAYNVLGSYVAGELSPDVGVILPEDYTLILSRGYLIPKQARNKEASQRMLDFLLSPEARDILSEIGLVMAQEPDETGLLPSARRLIALSPTLLVALDTNRRANLLSLWSNAFSSDVAEQ